MRKSSQCILLAITLICQVHFAWAQFQNLDSLELLLNKEKLSDDKRVNLLLEISELCLSQNPHKSILYIKEAVEISTRIQNTELLGLSYRLLGNYYSYEGDYDSCMLFLNKTLEQNPDDATAWFYYGQNEWYNGSTEDKCVLYYSRAENIARKQSDFKLLAIIYYSYSDYYRYTQKDSIAQYYISLSIKILEKSSLLSDLATAYNIQAEIYRKKGEYKHALETYIKTAKIAYQVLDSTRIGYCFGRMGYVYYMQNNFPLAEKFLIRSLDISENVRGRNMKLFALKALTDMFSNLADEKKCLYYANICLKEGLEMKEETAVSLVYSSLSNLYYRSHKADSAQYYANKAYEFAKEHDDPINMVNAILNKVPLEFESGNYKEVINLTTEGIEIAEYLETMEHLRDLYQYRYRAYEKLNNKTASFEAFDKYKMFEDSLRYDGVELGIKESELEIGYQDKHLADTLVYIENAQKSKQEILLQKQRSTYSIVIGFIVAVLLLVIIWIIWTTSKKRKKLNLSLAESNHVKELLLKEIHHRVKNSLQVVSSLLNLQKTYAERKTFDELIDESQAKIGNIAIVHELLYQSGTFTKINLRQYIDKLGNHILQTLSDPNKKVNIIKDIEDIEISLDKSVPLALVVNEIVTNSVKYAFKDRNEGVIRIECSRRGGMIEVRINDDGPGLPDTKLNSGKGIGITLIKGFIKQLKGELDYGNNNGCFFVFSFPDN